MANQHEVLFSIGGATERQPLDKDRRDIYLFDGLLGMSE